MSTSEQREGDGFLPSNTLVAASWVPTRPRRGPWYRATVLLDPFALGSLRLANRMVMAAMGTGFATPDGRPTPRLVAWYTARASGRLGLLLVEGTQVRDDEACRGAAVWRTRLASDGAIPEFARLAEAIRGAGTPPALQLSYPAAPDPGALGGAEAAAIVRAFGAAARRARAAGFAAVEVQCTSKVLLGQRPDLACEAVSRASAAFGAPVIAKISAGPGGETAARARALVGAGAAALEVHGGPEVLPPVRAAVGVPLIANAGLLKPAAAERVLAGGAAELVALGRALLADAAWLQKVRDGRGERIVPCVECGACFPFPRDTGTGCPVGGEAGLEYLGPVAPAERPRRVGVLGGGLAALETARVAAARGHRVALRLAGQPWGGCWAGRAGYRPALDWFRTALEELGVRIVTAFVAPPDVVVDCRPDGGGAPGADAAALRLGDTEDPAALRDLVRRAHLLARQL
jgi:2,4-dienoyl-CoA reductase-like NADH-dependent reductase (Old Yellow Enzyme family)